MTVLQDINERIDLNPDAPQPPFEVQLDLPAQWSLLDTNPATWQRSAEELLRTTFRATKLTSKERREVLGFFEQLVTDCQDAGAALSLLLVGRLEPGRAASLGIHFAFVEGTEEVTIGRLRDMLPHKGTIVEVESGVGPALLQSERMTMIPPGATELVALTSLQIHIPIPTTTWSVLIASASAYPELTDDLDGLLRKIAASFRADVPALTGQDGDSADSDSDSVDDAAFTEVSQAEGPGIERGFKTLVRKQLGSPSTAQQDGDSTDE